MQTRLSDAHAGTAAGRRAETLLRACVHCGFCNATCPTYRLTGAELDGPRGRIYLTKQIFEGGPVSAVTQAHLDRCLGCRSCETTCPSGVQYTELLELGRNALREQRPRPWTQRVMRALLRGVLLGPWFRPLYRVAQRLRPLLPRRLRDYVRPFQSPAAVAPTPGIRRVILPSGCVQPSALPGIDAAFVRVLQTLGVQALQPSARCCGALAHHTDDPCGSLQTARRNIDAWWPLIEDGVEAIVWTATACTLEIREYGARLADDPRYAERARRVSALARDPGEFLLGERERLVARLREASTCRVAFHAPCTLQHGLKGAAAVESVLEACGATVLPVVDRALCCGSAGAYALLQPEISDRLRRLKLEHLTALSPDVVLSANVGCLLHLSAGTTIPLRHWIEWVDERLQT